MYAMFAEPCEPTLVAVRFSVQSVTLCCNVLTVNDYRNIASSVMLFTQREEKVVQTAIDHVDYTTTDDRFLFWREISQIGLKRLQSWCLPV